MIKNCYIVKGRVIYLWGPALYNSNCVRHLSIVRVTNDPEVQDVHHDVEDDVLLEHDHARQGDGREPHPWLQVSISRQDGGQMPMEK